MSKEDICLHHFSLKFPLDDVKTRLSSTRFVLIAGCSRRVRDLGSYLAENVFNGEKKVKIHLEKLTHDDSRFDLHQIGPVLIANHGIGAPSMSTAVHELFLMCKLSNVLNKVKIIRFGTCGGIGVAPGTLCITTKVLDPLFRDYVEIPICGKLKRRSCVIDQKTASVLIRLATEQKAKTGNFEFKSGSTVSANDFYEEQGRTNGAICEHSTEDKMHFLEQARDNGVINFEMESIHLSAMCTKLNVRHGIFCVALNNRLLGDRASITQDQFRDFERRLFLINSLFIVDELEKSDKTYDLC